jgi:hypothetical protein
MLFHIAATIVPNAAMPASISSNHCNTYVNDNDRPQNTPLNGVNKIEILKKENNTNEKREKS